MGFPVSKCGRFAACFEGQAAGAENFFALSRLGDG